MTKKRGKRTRGREMALKALYASEFRSDPADVRPDSLAGTGEDRDMSEFARRLIEGCMGHLTEIDEIIQKVATNWRVDRMPNLDRNILRLATYELLYCQDTPPKVVINEAIELSKLYGTEGSPNFINGVLDKIYTDFSMTLKTKLKCNAVGGEPGRSSSRYVLKAPPTPPDPQKRADLHLHSNASDGELSPGAVVKEAGRCGLDAISLTDHDCIDGVEEAVRAGEDAGIYVVPGVEMSAYIHDTIGDKEYELHILGYYIDIFNEKLVEELEKLQKVRLFRVRRIAEKLAGCGIDIDVEEIIEEKNNTVGRLHVALKLIEMGVCGSVDEVFSKFLGDGMPAFVPKEKTSARHTIDMIHQAGGCAVLAHPGLAKGVEGVIDHLEDAGLDGIEVHYTGHKAEDAAFWLDVARRRNMVITGGSDFHGNPSGGAGPGAEAVSLVEVHGLFECSRRYGYVETFEK